MRVPVERPRLHDGQGAVQVFAQEAAHGKLGRAEIGEEPECLRRRIKIIEPVQAHKVRQRERGEFRLHARGQQAQHADGLPVLQGQRRVQTLGGAAKALHQGQFVQTMQHKAQKPLSLSNAGQTTAACCAMCRNRCSSKISFNATFWVVDMEVCCGLRCVVDRVLPLKSNSLTSWIQCGQTATRSGRKGCIFIKLPLCQSANRELV